MGWASVKVRWAGVDEDWARVDICSMKTKVCINIVVKSQILSTNCMVLLNSLSWFKITHFCLFAIMQAKIFKVIYL